MTKVYEEPPFYLGDSKPGGGAFSKEDADDWVRKNRPKFWKWMLRANTHFYRENRNTSCPHCPAITGPCLTQSRESAIRPIFLAYVLGTLSQLYEKIA